MVQLIAYPTSEFDCFLVDESRAEEPSDELLWPRFWEIVRAAVVRAN